jgi:hypothetical protein
LKVYGTVSDASASMTVPGCDAVPAGTNIAAAAAVPTMQINRPFTLPPFQ